MLFFPLFAFVIQAQMKSNLGLMKRVSFIWLLKLLKRMTLLNLSGQRTMKDHQMLTEFGLKRRAISEYIMHTQKMNCGLWNKECLKYREKCEGKGFPLLPIYK